MIKMELHCLPLLPHHISNPFQRSHSVLFQFQINFIPFFSSSLIFYLIRLNHSSSEVSFWLAFFFFICTFMLLVQALITSWLLSSAQTFPFHPTFLFLFVFVFFFFSFHPIFHCLSVVFYQAIFLKPAITVS